MILVECSTCDAVADIAREGDWTTPFGDTFDPFEETDYGDRILMALPSGWKTERVDLNLVIHCPEHTT